MQPMPPVEIVAVFRSFWRSACEERSLVLHAVGIDSRVMWLGRAWALVVPVDRQDAALMQIAQYERENPPRRRPAPAEPLHGGAWVGSAAYVAVLLWVGYLAGSLALGADGFDAGGLVAGPPRAGEFWRSLTALTLHLDVGHLLANLGFGVVFGLLAGQLLGPGVAWASVVLAAGKSADEASLIEHCRQHLAGYKVPRLIEFRAELPNTNVGTILRRLLREA